MYNNQDIHSPPVRIFEVKFVELSSESQNCHGITLINPLDMQKHFISFNENDFETVFEKLSHKKSIDFTSNELFYLVSQAIEKRAGSFNNLNTPSSSNLIKKKELKVGEKIWQSNSLISKVNYETCSIKSQTSY